MKANSTSPKKSGLKNLKVFEKLMQKYFFEKNLDFLLLLEFFLLQKNFDFGFQEHQWISDLYNRRRNNVMKNQPLSLHLQK